MPKTLDLSGKRFGLLTVVRLSGKNKFRRNTWLCRCDCGNESNPTTAALRSGNTRSCGCQANIGNRTRTHGGTVGGKKTPEYVAWRGMLTRCYNPKAPNYRYYGARGVTVCAEWRKDFAAFLAHVGPRPSPAHSIDRKKSAQPYRPGNVRWSTVAEQQNNRRDNLRVRVNGAEVSVKQIARALGLGYAAVYRRLMPLFSEAARKTA